MKKGQNVKIRKEHYHEHRKRKKSETHLHKQNHYHEDDCGCGHDHHHEDDGDFEHAHPHKESEQRHARGKQKIYILENLGCAHCASKMEDRIPLDGIVINGESRIDTSPITGEPVPVAVKKGESVISGCVNTSGALTIKVEHILEESMIKRILNSVENAAAGKPKIDRFITRFAHYYTPCVVLAALLVAIVPSLISGNWNYWIYTALTFLVMSCPCALVLSVPLAFFSGISTGSHKSILFKGGLSIEALNNVKAIVMDNRKKH